MRTAVYPVEGLSSEVEILVDRWGVPHIYADGLRDVFFGQGFNAARDRLWQLDLWKRRGDGTLSEVFGPGFVERDRAARLFLFRGDMQAEWRSYGADTRQIVSSFVDGLNAYIRLCLEDPELLPEEFEQLDYRPDLWTPETVVRIRSHGVLHNAASEVSRARFIRDHGVDALRFREFYQPDHEVEIPDGLDLSAFPDDVLKLYELAKSSVSLARTADGQLAPASDEHPDAAGPSGSNNWVIAPSRSTTGRPILANDPHRALSHPSLRYIAHLSAPGLDAIGAGEPAIPGISIGHNGRIAFGLTIFYIDQEDLYVYETHPERPDAYRYRGDWVSMEVVNERIPVRGAPPVDVALKYTQHGPVIYEDRGRRLAVGVRAAWLEPGMSPYLGGIGTMRARNWTEFLDAMKRWGLPGENMIYADVDGNIGWKPGGRVPIRPNWDGLLPVPGDGRYEWAGVRSPDELPVERNPERGWIATANQLTLPGDYPHAVGFEWVLPYRYERICELLERERRFSVDDMAKLQLDYRSPSADRVVALLAGLSSADPKVQRGLELMRAWSGDLDADSAPAALYEVWFHRHLARAAMAPWVEDASTLQAVLDGDQLWDVFEGSSVELWISRLEQPELWSGPQPRAARDAALLSSLAAAIDEVERLLGDAWEQWSWGRLHKAEFQHPLSAVSDAARRARLDIEPVPRGGSGNTVNSTWYELSTFVQQHGASFRMVLDVGEWDSSLAINAPGQSGDPSSPHYRDLVDGWARDEAFPLVYSRGRVEAEAEQRIVLQPQPNAADASERS